MSLCLKIGHYLNKSTTKSRSVAYFILVANELINIVFFFYFKELCIEDHHLMEHCLAIFSIHLPSLAELFLTIFSLNKGPHIRQFCHLSNSWLLNIYCTCNKLHIFMYLQRNYIAEHR